MRRLLIVALLAAAACGKDLLEPVTVVDGRWTGIQNGYSMSLSMSQAGTSVTGIVSLGGLGGSLDGTVTGTFTFPNVALTLSFDGLQDATYTGTMSQSSAKIDGSLNGSGLTNVQISVTKQR